MTLEMMLIRVAQESIDAAVQNGTRANIQERLVAATAVVIVQDMEKRGDTVNKAVMEVGDMRGKRNMGLGVMADVRRLLDLDVGKKVVMVRTRTSPLDMDVNNLRVTVEILIRLADTIAVNRSRTDVKNLPDTVGILIHLADTADARKNLMSRMSMANVDNKVTARAGMEGMILTAMVAAGKHPSAVAVPSMS